MLLACSLLNVADPKCVPYQRHPPRPVNTIALWVGCHPNLGPRTTQLQCANRLLFEVDYQGVRPAKAPTQHPPQHHRLSHLSLITNLSPPPPPAHTHPQQQPSPIPQDPLPSSCPPQNRRLRTLRRKLTVLKSMFFFMLFFSYDHDFCTMLCVSPPPLSHTPNLQAMDNLLFRPCPPRASTSASGMTRQPHGANFVDEAFELLFAATHNNTHTHPPPPLHHPIIIIIIITPQSPTPHLTHAHHKMLTGTRRLKAILVCSRQSWQSSAAS